MHREAEHGEVARILRDIAEKVEQGRTDGKVMDVNGNSVGEFAFYQGRTDGGLREFRVRIETDNDAFHAH